MQIDLAEYQNRRQLLMERMGEGAIAVLPAAEEKLRNRDTHYLFRQNSDFYYLTGFEESNAVLVIAPGRAHAETILFCEERDPLLEQWTGVRMGPERAGQQLGLDDAFPASDLADILPGMLEGRERIFTTLGEHPDFDRDLLAWLHQLSERDVGGPGEIVALSHLLHDLRLYKSAAELKLMKQAAAITEKAHRRAMSRCTPGMNESELEAEIIYEFMRSGARHPAYPCIVASGENACVLHYTRNNAPMQDGELVLIDAGCEYQNYASDVTRTYPVNGKFSEPQRLIYEIVLRAQEAAIAEVKPGNDFNQPHDAAIGVMIEGLIDLGLLHGTPDEVRENGSYRNYCSHKVSHWLGLDVHDVGDYRVGDAWRLLEAGMVLTVEPGLYITRNADVDKKWWNLGVRIEDDVVVTHKGHQVMTRALPRTVAEIEACMAQPSP